jgi:hypothetical protein
MRFHTLTHPSSTHSRASAAARADPEGAACVALLAGCAMYALTADRRGLRQALGTVGTALSSLASMATGGMGV